jgi:hypothetical protein
METEYDGQKHIILSRKKERKKERKKDFYYPSFHLFPGLILAAGPLFLFNFCIFGRSCS